MGFPSVCPECKAKFNLGDPLLGKKVMCPKCKNPFVAQPNGKGDTRISKVATGPVGAAAKMPANPPAPRAKRSMVPWVIGGVVVGLAGLMFVSVAVGAVLWFTLKSSPSQVAQTPPTPRVEAFPADLSPKTVSAPVLDPAPKTEPKADPAPKAEIPKTEVPKADPAPEPAPSKGQLSATALKHLKGATVFVKFDAGPDSCTGSGFLVIVNNDTGYIVTNHHVINPEAERLSTVRVRRPGGGTAIGVRVIKYKPRGTISAVFHSGSKQEFTARADVVATDNSRDLAVLSVKGVKELPKSIDLSAKAGLIETMPVYILGFPFGEALAMKKGNPAVTVNKGSVSSLREDEFGQMKTVQIDGAINPGNSGGPVVDEAGRLIGISVATIRGAGIGLAIAPDELSRMFDGRVGGIDMKPRRVDANAAEFDITMSLIDPLQKIQSAAVLYQVAAVPAPLLQHNADGSFNPITGTRAELKVAEQIASGAFTVDRKASPGRFLVFQTAYVNGAGKTMYTQVISKPIDAVVANAPPPNPNPVALPNSPTQVGDMNVEEVAGVAAGDIPRCILWDAEGKHFYCLEGSKGIIKKFALGGLKEVAKGELETPCKWMSWSAEGLVLAAQATQEVLIVDAQELKIKRKVSAPKVKSVASAPNLSFAFADCGDLLSVLDLKKGELVRQYKGGDFGAKFGVGFLQTTCTPDGKYLFTRGGIEQLHRFRIDKDALVFEQSSERIAQNGQCIEVSLDSKWVSLPSGGGNYNAGASYSTIVYSVENIATGAVTVTGGAYPRAMGFDPKLNYAYTMNHDHQLVIFTMKGLKLKEYNIRNGGETKQILAHPDGNGVLLLTDKKLMHVTFKK